MNVSNRKCVRHLAWRSLWANRTRNVVAVLAITLTTVLFTSLFTIAISINDGIEQNNFRQAGGWSHGGFKYLTQEQFDELKEDPLIKEWGMRRFLGMPSQVPFNKSHVEVGYSNANEAHWTYCDPVEGRLPQEGTDEAATDTYVLSLLGVEPELGAKFTVTFEVDGHTTTQTFTLCGWWEYDEAIVANHILIPESRVDAVLAEVGVTPPGSDGMTGTWNMDVMLKSGARHIAQDLNEILENHGYQSQTVGENYISIGVNWGYTGAQLSDKLDPATALVLILVIVLIIFTGYLIIYNVFQISVAGDIRFYGLLKTIGTTPRQLKRMIRIQALALSVVGIPIGLLLGWIVGGALVPVVVARLNGVIGMVSLNPAIFVGAALFSLITVLISCRKPGRMAAKVSPIEALRYTEGGGLKKSRRTGTRVSLLSMAWANLGRSRGKTVITILSLSLAVVLLSMTVTFANGFDMEKYTANFTASDFILADAGQFQSEGFSEEMAVPGEVIDAVNAQGGITEGGRIYGKVSAVLEFVTEEYFRSMWGRWNDEEQIDNMLHFRDHTEDGRVADRVQLYGMEPFALDHLTVLEGDIDQLNDPDGRYIAAVYSEDDYGNPEMSSHWARMGDTVTLRYVDEYEYYNPDTGEVYGSFQDVPEGANWVERAVKYQDVDYTVAAIVTVPSAFSYRYYGADEFIMGSETFLRDTGTDCVMYYAFDTTEEANAPMEEFLKDYTQNQNPQFDYESKSTYAAEFEGVRNMFLLLGGALSFIVGLVGVLNFFNAIVTGITVRRREFAVLQSIGMTGRQLKGMLIREGLLYTIGAAAFSLVLTLVLCPMLSGVMEHILWFFTYQFTLMPVAAVTPIFALIGILIPLWSYRVAARQTIVERLRQE